MPIDSFTNSTSGSQLPAPSAALNIISCLTTATSVGEHGIALFSFAFLRYLIGLAIFLCFQPSGVCLINCLPVAFAYGVFIILIDLQELFI